MSKEIVGQTPKETYEVGEIRLTWCPSCFNCDISHPNTLVFHRIEYQFLARHPNGILDPKNFSQEDYRNFRPPDEEDFEKTNLEYNQAYKKYLGAMRIHLGDLMMAGISNQGKEDVYFAFDLETLKVNYPTLLIMDHGTWFALAFFAHDEVSNQEEEQALKRELLGRKYISGTSEVLLPKLKLRLAKFALFCSEDAKRILSDLKIISLDGRELKERILAYDEKNLRYENKCLFCERI